MEKKIKSNPKNKTSRKVKKKGKLFTFLFAKEKN